MPNAGAQEIGTTFDTAEKATNTRAVVEANEATPVA